MPNIILLHRNRLAPLLPAAVGLLLALIAAPSVRAEEASGAPEKLAERIARGSPKDREYLHGAATSVRNWASTEADLKLAASLRDSFRKWAPASYADTVRWIEVEQAFGGPLSGPVLAEAAGHLARLNRESGSCRVPPELADLAEFSAADAEVIEKEVLLPCESQTPDDTTAALGAVIQPARTAARPKEVAVWLDRTMKDRKPSASLCQATRVTNVLLARWVPYDACAKMLPAGADRADFARGAALELLDSGRPDLAVKAVQRPWAGKAEKPHLQDIQIRALVAQKKTAQARTGLEAILKNEPLDSPGLVWAAGIAPEAALSPLIARIGSVLGDPAAEADSITEAATALEAALSARCPQAADPLSPAPDCKLAGSPALWRKTLLDRLTAGDTPSSVRRAAERALLLLPAAAWKGTAPHVCTGAGLTDAPLPVLKSLATFCRRIAGAAEAPAISERMKTAGHAERRTLLEGLAAGGVDPVLAAALKGDLETLVDDAARPLSERRLALLSLVQRDCPAQKARLEALVRGPELLLAEPAARGLSCVPGPEETLEAVITSEKSDAALRFAAVESLARLNAERARAAAAKLPAAWQADAARAAGPAVSPLTIRARYLDFAASGLIYPAVRKADGREVFLVENLKAEPVLRVESAADLGPEIVIGLENLRDDGELSASPRTLRLFRQAGSTVYVSEKYPAEFAGDGSLKREAGGGGWSEF